MLLKLDFSAHLCTQPHTLNVIVMCFHCRFGIENFLLDQHVRYILTIYPVVIIALVGNVTKHYGPAAPSANAIFMGE